MLFSDHILVFIIFLWKGISRLAILAVTGNFCSVWFWSKWRQILYLRGSSKHRWYLEVIIHDVDKECANILISSEKSSQSFQLWEGIQSLQSSVFIPLFFFPVFSNASLRGSAWLLCDIPKDVVKGIPCTTKANYIHFSKFFWQRGE